MSILMTREYLWVENRQFYQELVEKYHWKQEPMIDLIDQLQQAGFCEKFYPSNSHEALGLSTVKEYLLRTERNIVYILYNSNTDKFEVIYQKGQGNTINKEICEREAIALKFGDIETWLYQTPE